MTLSCTTVFAQDDYEALLTGKKLRFSAFAASLFEFSAVNQSFGFSSGWGGAVLLNQTIFIGGYKLNLAPVNSDNLVLDGTAYTNSEIEFNHGGLWFGYINNHRKLVHFGASARFGWGRISIDDPLLTDAYEDNVLVITPQVEAEVNIAKWFKINGGVGYRIVSGVNEAVMKNADFNSPTATVSFMFGWFRQRK